MRFIFIAPVIHEEFYLPLKKGMNDAAAMMNVEAVFTGTDGVKIDTLANFVTRAVTEGYDGIAVNMIDQQAFNPAVQWAMDQGVPVVAFNTDAPESGRMSAVSQNVFEAGRTVGAKVLDLIPTGSKVLITMHDAGILGLERRRDGILAKLDAGGIAHVVITAASTPEASIPIISRALHDDPSIRFLCCTGQADTEAAGLVIEQEFAGRGYGVAGFDLSNEILRLILNGVIHCAIDQQPYVQGFYPVVQLALYCRYGIRPSNMDSGATIVTANEAAKLLKMKRDNFR
jgi:simple sugar transport system substrate-binding protein